MRLRLGLWAIALFLFAHSATAAVFVSDDFSAPNLNQAVWSPIDPVGDAAFTVSNGELAVSVGGGIDHDIWTSGNMSARVMQPTDNVDFEIEAKYASIPNLRYQLQGILVEQDSSNFIRFDIYSDGAGVKSFSASFSGGSPTIRHNSGLAGQLAVAIILGAIVFVAMMLLLWRLAGYPVGAEQIVLDRLAPKLRDAFGKGAAG